MNNICRDIFRAIHEGKWLKIEYRNRKNQMTKYWIGIRDLNVSKRTLAVEGLHLGQYTVDSYESIYIDSILSSQIVEGSFYDVNREIIEDIYINPHKYKTLFDNTANIKVLNYLEMCNLMDATPYCADFELIRFLDGDSFKSNVYQLSNEQFEMIVNHFQHKMEQKNRKDGKYTIQQLAMNVLSIHTKKGLYVLAYKKLLLDVKNRVLRPEPDITICTEYVIDGMRESIRKYLDADDYELLNDFEKNQEKIKDIVAKHTKLVMGVDDMPYIIGLGMDIALDLHKEYEAIIEMCDEDKITIPIKAFFNDKTVLFTSYNNHPINSVFKKLTNMTYKSRRILFPVLRLGNIEVMGEAIEYIKEVYNQVKDIDIDMYEMALEKRKSIYIERAKQLTKLLEMYEDILGLKERRDTLSRMLDYQERSETVNKMTMFPFYTNLYGNQLQKIKGKINEAGEVTEEEALQLLDTDFEQLYQYLYFLSAKYIKRLGEPRYSDLRNIIFHESEETQVISFRRYLSETKNIKNLQRIFPIIITTCISAHKIGEPKPTFDMVIIDEASQCNTAISLVPIIRGESLMLVGDPQQLNPVILLDKNINKKLMKKYNVSDEYDYCKNSIYKVFLACDSVSDEILLHNHYRCNKKIIEFNNKKYYNSRLKVCSNSQELKPLVYKDIKSEYTNVKNTAPAEVEAIIEYAAVNKDKNIGVITPFVNQKKMICLN